MPTDPTTTSPQTSPETPDALCGILEDNFQGSRRAVYPAGGGTALDFGFPPPSPGLTLRTEKLNRLVDYPARDMTVTAEAGMTCAQLAALLREQRQQLPIDVPQAERATLGGIVACDVSGPRRFGHGTLRDYVIGVTAVDAEGRLFSAGGRVVKNVAGYDLCKLLVGSLGTLAVITQLTFKLRPLPESSALLCLSIPDPHDIDRFLEALLHSAARPVAVDVLSPEVAAGLAVNGTPAHNVLCLGVEGTPREVEWQVDALRQECRGFPVAGDTLLSDAAAEQAWQYLTEWPAGKGGSLTFRANLLPSQTMAFIEHACRAGIAVQAHAASGIVTGRLPRGLDGLAQASSLLDPLREMAAGAHGNLTVLDCPADWKAQLPLFGRPEPAWTLMRQIKAELDPGHLLNPGRFIDGVVYA